MKYNNNRDKNNATGRPHTPKLVNACTKCIFLLWPPQRTIRREDIKFCDAFISVLMLSSVTTQVTTLCGTNYERSWFTAS